MLMASELSIQRYETISSPTGEPVYGYRLHGGPMVRNFRSLDKALAATPYLQGTTEDGQAIVSAELVRRMTWEELSKLFGGGEVT